MEGLSLVVGTAFTPARIPSVVPLPAELSTLTDFKLTFLATPYVVPPIVPAHYNELKESNME